MYQKLAMLSVLSGISLCYAMEEIRSLPVGVFFEQNERKSQEDRFYCGDVDGGKMFAVYDGHGGAEVASFLAYNLPQYFKDTSALIESGSIEERMKKAFEMADGDDFVKKERCGSTASLVFVKDKVAHFAHVGDSRALLECDGKYFATNDHNIHNGKECVRIEQAGGVWYKNRVNGCLPITRAFGNYHLDKNKQIIIVEPDYTEKQLTEKNKFLFLATDGFWDKVTNDEVAELLTKHYVHCKDMHKLAEFLGQVAIGRGSKDNITVMVILLS